MKDVFSVLAFGLAVARTLNAAPSPEKRATVSVVSASTITALTPYGQVCQM